jgi:hypothetical protein
MARAHSPYLLRGKIFNHIFRVRDGKQQVYLAPFPTKRNNATFGRPENKAYLQNIEEFAAASSIDSEIYRSLNIHDPGLKDPNAVGPIFRPYSHNILAARLKKYADYVHKLKCQAANPRNPGKGFARKFLIRDGARAFQDLDLSHDDAPTQRIQMQALGPQHNPNAIKIKGLQSAAAVLLAHGNARIEFRIHIRQSRFQEKVYNEVEKRWADLQIDTQQYPDADKHRDTIPPSNWIPTEIIPQDGITIDIPQWTPIEKYVTAILIEWREIRTVGRKIKALHTMGIVRIVAVHAPAESWIEPDADQIPKWEALLLNAFPSAEPAQGWEQDPQGYLRSALQSLKPLGTG